MLQKQHIGVYGLIIPNNQILLVKKSRGPYTGMYDLPGGSFEHGEDIDNCLRREIKEETGIIVNEYEWFDNYSAQIDYEENNEKKSMHHIGLIYNITDWDNTNFNEYINFEDVSSCKFVDIDSIYSDDVSPFVNITMQTLKN